MTPLLHSAGDTTSAAKQAAYETIRRQRREAEGTRIAVELAEKARRVETEAAEREKAGG